MEYRRRHAVQLTVLAAPSSTARQVAQVAEAAVHTWTSLAAFPPRAWAAYPIMGAQVRQESGVSVAAVVAAQLAVAAFPAQVALALCGHLSPCRRWVVVRRLVMELVALEEFVLATVLDALLLVQLGLQELPEIQTLEMVAEAARGFA